MKKTIGLTCPPYPGHLNPMLALGVELRQRGHRVLMLSVADVADKVREHDLEFACVGREDCGPGWLRSGLESISRLGNLAASKVAAKLMVDLTRVLLRDGPELIRSHGIDALLVDQIELAGSSLAQQARIPFITVSTALLMDRESDVPPNFTPWPPGSSRFARLRNRLLNEVQDLALRPVTKLVNEHRRGWNLPLYKRVPDYWSSIAEISQCPGGFDFARRELPAHWHGVGPLRQEQEDLPFPAERLDGRPLVYASFGSMQGGRRALFASIAEACAPLDVQLLISHGHGLRPQETLGFAGDPLVLPYVPQREVMKRASLVFTHCGLNTVLDAVSLGVPMVAVPIAFEQSGIAARVAWHRVGRVVPAGRATPARLREAAREVLQQSSYRSAAERLGKAIEVAGGVQRAAHVCELAMSTGKPVTAASLRLSMRAEPAASRLGVREVSELQTGGV